MVIKDLKHEGHKGNEGALSDDYVGLSSFITRDGQKEIATLRESLTFVSFVTLCV